MPSSGRWGLRLAGASLLLSVAAACAAPLFVLPTGPGEPAPDAGSAWTAATAGCRAVSGLTAALRVSGTVGGDKLPTTIAIQTGVTPDALDLEGRAAGRNIFRLAGDGQRATLLLYDGSRYATGTPEELADALVGVKLGPARWLALLTGCAIPPTEALSGARYPHGLAVTTASGRAYLEATPAGGWQIAAGVFDDLLVSFRWKAARPQPAAWSLTSRPDRDPAVSLAVTVDDLQAGHVPGAGAFAVALPAEAVPMTLADLRQSGPLRKKG